MLFKQLMSDFPPFPYLAHTTITVMWSVLDQSEPPSLLLFTWLPHGNCFLTVGQQFLILSNISELCLYKWFSLHPSDDGYMDSWKLRFPVKNRNSHTLLFKLHCLTWKYVCSGPTDTFGSGTSDHWSRRYSHSTLIIDGDSYAGHWWTLRSNTT